MRQLAILNERLAELEHLYHVLDGEERRRVCFSYDIKAFEPCSDSYLKPREPISTEIGDGKMPFDLEKVCNDIRELRALRDEHKSSIYVELALDILSVAPETNISEVRTVMKARRGGYQKAKEQFFDPAIKRAREQDKVFEKNHDIVAASLTPRNFCCPLVKGRKVPKCCCKSLPGCNESGDSDLSSSTSTMGDVRALYLCAGVTPKGVASAVKNNRNTKFSDLVKSIMQKKDNNDLFYDGTIPNIKTIKSWENGKIYTSPNILTLAAFWLRTETYYSERTSMELFNTAGIKLKAQFDIHLLIQYIIKNRNIYPLDKYDFNAVLEHLGLPKTLRI